MRREERERRATYITERKAERQAIAQWMGLARSENRRLLYHSPQIGDFARRTSFCADTQSMFNKSTITINAHRTVLDQTVPAEEVMTVNPALALEVLEPAGNGSGNSGNGNENGHSDHGDDGDEGTVTTETRNMVV